MGDIIWEEFVEKRDLREKPQEILLEVDGGGKERVGEKTGAERKPVKTWGREVYFQRLKWSSVCCQKEFKSNEA